MGPAALAAGQTGTTWDWKVCTDVIEKPTDEERKPAALA